MPPDHDPKKPASGLNFEAWERSRGMSLPGDAPTDEGQYVWVRYPADQAPRDGVEYVSAVDGGSSYPFGSSVDADAFADKVADRIAARAGTPVDQGQSAASHDLPILVRVPEAAKIASMTERALRHLIQRSQLPRGVVVWRGRAVFIDRKRFETALRQPLPRRASDPTARRGGAT